tara:strand:- start:421 stop:624 length:204 start_codon:yes stop_codon:yes gene_type:complete
MSAEDDILSKLTQIRRDLTEHLKYVKKVGDIPKDIQTKLTQIEANLTELYKEIDFLTNQTKLDIKWD